MHLTISQHVQRFLRTLVIFLKMIRTFPGSHSRMFYLYTNHNQVVSTFLRTLKLICCQRVRFETAILCPHLLSESVLAKAVKAQILLAMRNIGLWCVRRPRPVDYSFQPAGVRWCKKSAGTHQLYICMLQNNMKYFYNDYLLK